MVWRVLFCALILLTLAGAIPAESAGRDRRSQRLLHEARRELVEKNNPEKARRSLQKWLAQSPNHADARAYFLLGLSWQMTGDWEEAIAAYRKALELDASLDEARTNLAPCLYRLGRFAEAGAAWSDRYERTGRKDKGILYKAALAFYRAGDMDRARRAADGFRRQAASEKEWTLLLVRLDTATGKTEAAEDALTRFLDRDPDHPDLWRRAAALRRRLDRPAEAAAALEVAHGFEPPDADGWRTLGDVYFAAGAPLEGVRCLERLDPDELTGEDMIRAAQRLTAIHRYDKALRWSQRAIERNPGDPGALMAAGHALMGLRRYADAQERFHRAAALKPDREDARYWLGRSAFLSGDWSTARKWLADLAASARFAEAASKMLAAMEPLATDR